MPEAVLGGTPAFWRQEGAGARRAVFLHCTFAHSGAWKAVMAALAADLSMQAMDLPAHGRSGNRDFTRSWQSQSVAMVRDLVERGDRPVDLIGHSFGATVALRLAVESPELVRSLTLIEPVFFSAAREQERTEYDAHMVDHGAFYDLLVAGDYEGAAKGFSAMWGGPIAWDEQSEAQRKYMIERIELIKDSGNTALGVGEDHIPLARIAELKMPVLLIEGATSEPIIGAVQAALSETISDAKRIVVPKAGHMVPITHANVVAGELRRFWGL